MLKTYFHWRSKLCLTSSWDFSNRILVPSESEEPVYCNTWVSITMNNPKITHRLKFYWICLVLSLLHEQMPMSCSNNRDKSIPPVLSHSSLKKKKKSLLAISIQTLWRVRNHPWVHQSQHIQTQFQLWSIILGNWFLETFCPYYMNILLSNVIFSHYV